MTQPTTEPQQPGPPEDSPEVAALKLEVAKWRVIAFWGLPRDTHELVTGDTAQELEDKAHQLAGMLHLIPITK